MKKPFAVFCAFVLLPLFSAQAWIGGPFSNNAYFGESGDDGVYEAVATGKNALGIYRIVVGNQFAGVNPSAVVASLPQQTGSGNTGPIVTNNGIASGNVVIGGLRSTWTNIWFFEGISYFGDALGTVNSATGRVVGVGYAVDQANAANIIDSFFRAHLIRTGRFLPAIAFSGRGTFYITAGGTVQTDERHRFSIFGNKVSDDILYGL